MGKGVAVVEHRVSTDPVYCTFSSPDDGFMEKTVCNYQTYRDRNSRGGRIDRELLRCKLFNEWLDKSGFDCLRCDACKRACGEL